ncbi:MAG TPA: dienelactone hydrolase family protein [Deltaproteobacteria bacterium]|jgi:alpha-beta hydrolase superfamily lysophospholipase|nr:dienelactone hydrolase family protein [Deltaproteobacteria bacterium]HQJ07891.1 dienelactone hydrolase family protein [Deltaproteobacteria bacterium]
MGTRELLRIPLDQVSLEGELVIPENPQGLIIFAHGAGSSRLSPRNNYVAGLFQENGFGTFLFDLLTEQEDLVYSNRFNIDLISERMAGSTRWVKDNTAARDLPIGYFGASTGSAAALKASVEGSVDIRAVVSRGGRPDLVMEILPMVKAPTLLIVGGEDTVVISLNMEAYKALTAEKDLKIIPGATHLFEEPGKLDEVAELAAQWFTAHLIP